MGVTLWYDFSLHLFSIPVNTLLESSLAGLHNISSVFSLSAGTVEYIDCFSAEV